MSSPGAGPINASPKLIRGFAPVCGVNPRVLILGSMPGVASLDAQEYYAMSRNAFWPIMDKLFAAGFALAYPARLQILKHRQIALWDVLGSCTRPGSLDASIDMQSIVVNDFGALLSANPGIERIFFNGKKASELYRRHVLPELSADYSALKRVTLPSTSPAHAALSFTGKLAAWSAVRDAVQPE